MKLVLLFVLNTGQQPSVAVGSGLFSRAYLWGMVPYAVFENLKRCLQVSQHAITYERVHFTLCLSCYLNM